MRLTRKRWGVSQGHDWLPAVVGIATMVVMRLLDYTLPKGWAWRRSIRHSVKVKPDEEDDE